MTKELTEVLERIRDLADGALRRTGKSTMKVKANKPSGAHRTSPDLSFRLNPLAFMKRHAKGLNGSRKFALLLARLAGGEVGKEVPVEEITSTWNKMKSVLGSPYNGAHATRAKSEGWVDSPKKGVYALADSWKESLGDE